MSTNSKYSLRALLTFFIAALLLLPAVTSAEKTDYSYFVQSELSESQTLDLESKATKLEKGDFDDDGRNDFVLLNEDGTLKLSQNKSGRLGSLKTIVSNKNVTDFTVADINNDLVEDVIFTAENRVYKLISTPNQNNTFEQPTSIFTANSKLEIIRSGDTEIDKQAEFAVASDDRVYIIENDGSEPESIQIEGTIKEVLFLDYDENLRLDLVIHSLGPNKVRYFKGIKNNKYQPDFSKEFNTNELRKIEKMDNMIFFDKANSSNFTYRTSNVVGENIDRIEVNTTTTNYPLGNPKEAERLNFDRFAMLEDMPNDRQREEVIFLNSSGSAIHKTVPFRGYKKDLAKARIYQDKTRSFSDFVISDIDSNKTRDIVLVDNQNMELVLLKNKDRICSFKKNPVCVSLAEGNDSVRNMCIAEKIEEMSIKAKKASSKKVEDTSLTKVKDKVCSGDEGKFKAGTECMKYKPVCGEDGVTYYNKCWAETFNKDYYLGKCETMKVNKSVCKLKKQEFEQQIDAVEKLVSEGKSKKQLEQSPELNFVPRQGYFASYLTKLLPMCEQQFGQISDKSSNDQTVSSNNGSNLNQTTSESCPLKTGQPYKRKGLRAVYLVTEDTKATPDKDESCRIMPIRRAEIYYEYFDSWDPVQTVTKSKLDRVDSFGFAPRGPKANIKIQSLITTPFTSEVYLLMKGDLYRFKNLKALKNHGFEPSDIIDIHPKLMSQLKTDNQIKILKQDDQKIIPGLVYKKRGSSDVYLKQDSGKRRFSSFRELNQFAVDNNYKLRNIAEVELN